MVFIKDLVESWHVTSLFFHLVGWEESPQLPGSYILGKRTAMELRPEKPRFLSSSSPQKSLQSMDVYQGFSCCRVLCKQAAPSLSKQELWEKYSNDLKLRSFLVPWISMFLGLWGSPLVVKGLQGLFCPAPHKSQHVLRCSGIHRKSR